MNAKPCAHFPSFRANDSFNNTPVDFTFLDKLGWFGGIIWDHINFLKVSTNQKSTGLSEAAYKAIGRCSNALSPDQAGNQHQPLNAHGRWYSPAEVMVCLKTAGYRHQTGAKQNEQRLQSRFLYKKTSKRAKNQERPHRFGRNFRIWTDSFRLLEFLHFFKWILQAQFHPDTPSRHSLSKVQQLASRCRQCRHWHNCRLCTCQSKHQSLPWLVPSRPFGQHPCSQPCLAKWQYKSSAKLFHRRRRGATAACRQTDCSWCLSWWLPLPRCLHSELSHPTRKRCPAWREAQCAAKFGKSGSQWSQPWLLGHPGHSSPCWASAQHPPSRHGELTMPWTAQPRPCLSPLQSSRCRDLRWARFPGHKTSWYHRGQTDCAGPMQASHSSNMFKITFDKTHIALTQIWLKETTVTSCFTELCTLSEFRGG